MKTVAVFFGGRSAEHDVSIITAHIPIIEALKASGRYRIIPVYIATDGGWYSLDEMLELDYFKQPDFAAQLTAKRQLQISFDGGLKLIWPSLKPKTVAVDVAFPAMHGTYGEDGTLMGLLRLANIPFVGCDLQASAVAMDKVLTKQATESLGIPSVKYAWFTAAEYDADPKSCLKRLGDLKYPLFVKPVHLGSSVAITHVTKPAELADALEVALHYDDKVIVEEAVQNLVEVTLPIIGNDELMLAHIEQPIAGFFDFETKYLKGGKKGSGGVNAQYSHIPAQIPEKTAERVRQIGRDTFRAIGASGIVRVDFLINGATQEVFMNEVNTLPGSLYVHNWRQSGVSGVELVERLIALAEERHAAVRKRAFVFRSSILQQVGGAKHQG